jgi:hypothetical protein
MSRMNKALGMLAALGVLAWFTLDDVPLHAGPMRFSLRSATLLILGLFAFRTWIHGKRLRLEEAARRDADGTPQDGVGRE